MRPAIVRLLPTVSLVVMCLSWWAVAAGGQAQPVAPQAPRAGLRIVVLEGEDAVNVIQQKTAVAPVVAVRDRNDQPVAGAVVRFAIRSGHASFRGAQTLTVTTDAAGRAVASGLAPTGSGTLRIAATAAFRGETAAASIVQTNVMTAAEAAAVSTSGAAGGGAGAGAAGTSGTAGVGGAVGGGATTVGATTAAGAAGAAGGSAAGGLSAATIGIIGGAAVGGAVAAKELTTTAPDAVVTTYTGRFSGPFTEVWPRANPCIVEDTLNGTLTLSLESRPDGTLGGEATVVGTLVRISLGSGCQGFSLADGDVWNEVIPIAGTAGALSFKVDKSNPVSGGAVHHSTLSFTGSVNDGRISGAVTVTEVTGVGTSVAGSGSGSYPVVPQ